MTIAQDSNQRIYGHAMQSWEDLGLPDLKVQRLVRQYRNTRPIAKLAARIINKSNPFEQFAGAEGVDPAWIEAAEWPGIVEKVADAVAGLVKAGDQEGFSLKIAENGRSGGNGNSAPGKHFLRFDFKFELFDPLQ